MAFRHCTIIGLGLLGGSLALDLRRHYPEMTIAGVARRQETLDEATALRCDAQVVFDVLSTSLEPARESDLVILCTPVQTILAQLVALAPLLAAGAIVTDVGSTKRAVMNAATVLPAGVYFVGGHPMAGSERKGLAAAQLNLYQGASWALCVPSDAEDAAARLSELIRVLGGVPLYLDADTHDALVALSSHLPHVVAGALTNVVFGSADAEAVLPFIAGGFRDSTRIAAASPVMWRDICLTNRDQILPALDAMLEELAHWRAAILAGDAPLLEALLTTARERRLRVK